MALWIDPVACCTPAPQRDHSSPHSRRASRARGSCAPRPHPRAPPLAGAARGPALSHVPAVRPATACYSAAAVLLLGFFSFFFFKLLLQIKLSKAPPEADPDLRTPPRGQKVALPAALAHQRIRRCATFQKVNCVWHRRYRRGAHQRILRKQLEVPGASPWHCRIPRRASLSMTD